MRSDVDVVRRDGDVGIGTVKANDAVNKNADPKTKRRREHIFELLVDEQSHSHPRAEKHPKWNVGSVISRTMMML